MTKESAYISAIITALLITLCGSCKEDDRLSDEEEKMYLNIESNINEESTETEYYNKSQLNDLFDVIYDGTKNYFYIIAEVYKYF